MLNILRKVAKRLLGGRSTRLSEYQTKYFALHGHIARRTRAGVQTVLDKTPGADPNRQSTRIAVFVHFDNTGTVHDYVLTYLDALNAAGFRIWFVTNSKTIDVAATDAVRSRVAWTYRRNNFGYDFGAYKDGILAALAEASPTEILICNDSVYGPFQPLAPILERARSADADVWGMTESYEKRYHLQTYFILFHAAAIAHPSFLTFWRDAPYVDTRGWLIHHGEIALSQKLLRGGLRLKALFPHEAIVDFLQDQLDSDAETTILKRSKIPPSREIFRSFHTPVTQTLLSGVPLNPTHFCWDTLIKDLKFPFLKRDLLQFNPAGIPTISAWRQVISSASSYDTDQIRRHLLLRLRGRAI